MNTKIIIAVDGYSGCGKSSTAKQVAKEIGYSYIDTGAMYRATTLFFTNNFVRLTNEKEVAQALSEIEITFRINPNTGDSDVYLNGLNVEREIRHMDISKRVSVVSAIKEVRVAMVEQQRNMGKKKGVVMDGRDIGTTVFPDAELKIFMTADMDVRSMRRQKELYAKGEVVPLEEVKKNLTERDRIDTSRTESPLTRAEDAITLDTTHYVFETQVQFVIEQIKARIKQLEESKQSES